MAGGARATIGAAAIRRQQMTGKKGISALMENKRAFFIAVFASLVYCVAIEDLVTDSMLASVVFYMVTNKESWDKPW